MIRTSLFPAFVQPAVFPTSAVEQREGARPKMVTISTGLNTDEWQQVAGALQKAAKQGKGSLPKATVTPKTNPLGHITATGISIRTHADKADRIVEQLEVLLSKWLHPKQVFKIHNPQEK